MSDLTLSKAEVRELCRTPIKARQVAFLVRNGIRHYKDGHGWPVVLRGAIEGSQSQARGHNDAWKPRKSA